MKRAVVIFALVSTVAGVASAQMLRSPASVPPPSVSSSVTSAPRAAAETTTRQEAPRATPTLAARQAPVPMVLSRRTPVAVPVAAPATAPEPALSEPEKTTGLTEADARAAIVADGYKKVLAVSKTADGTWRARALRGATEVSLRVDARGNVIGE
jgi:hypothetical protein